MPGNESWLDVDHFRVPCPPLVVTGTDGRKGALWCFEVRKPGTKVSDCKLRRARFTTNLSGHGPSYRLRMKTLVDENLGSDSPIGRLGLRPWASGGLVQSWRQLCQVYSNYVQ